MVLFLCPTPPWSPLADPKKNSTRRDSFSPQPAFFFPFLYILKTFLAFSFSHKQIGQFFSIMLHYLRAIPTLPKPYRSSRPSIAALPSDDMPASTTTPVVSFTEVSLVNGDTNTTALTATAMTAAGQETSHIVANGSNLVHPTPTALSIPRSITMDTMDINASLHGGESSSYPEDLCPPDNFNMVSTWIYRSSFPKKKNFSFLKKLGLKSIL